MYTSEHIQTQENDISKLTNPRFDIDSPICSLRGIIEHVLPEQIFAGYYDRTNGKTTLQLSSRYGNCSIPVIPLLRNSGRLFFRGVTLLACFYRNIGTSKITELGRMRNTDCRIRLRLRIDIVLSFRAIDQFILLKIIKIIE